MKETEQRLSIVDGSVEATKPPARQEYNRTLVPIYMTRAVRRTGMDGEEEVEQKVLVGFKEQADEEAV